MMKNTYAEFEKKIDEIQGYNNAIKKLMSVSGDEVSALSVKKQFITAGGKVFHYSLIIVNAYGVIEWFTEHIIKAYLEDVSMLVDTYESLPKTICNNHYSFTVELLKIKEKMVKYQHLKDEDIIVVKENMMEDSCYVPENTTKKHSIWPFMLTFCLLFVLFVLAFISWGENGFNNTFFDKMTTNVKGFTLFGFPLFAKLLGTFNSFGSWTITDLLLPMTLMVLLLVIIYKVPFEDVRLGFKQGAKRALGPAVIVILTYTVLVLVVYHPFQLVIYKAVLDLAKGFNVATTVVVAILSGFFNSDVSYSMQSILPYYASLGYSSDIYGTAAIIFQAMYGLTSLVAPTSLVLLATLSYLKISYKDWMKNIWKLLLELFVVLLIVFIILAVI